MDDAHRRKIGHWLISMLLICTSMAVGFCLNWFRTVKLVMIAGDPDSYADKIAGPIGDSLMLYPPLFLIALLWHCGDFFGADRPHRTAAQAANRYRFFFLQLLVACLLAALIASDWFLSYGLCGSMLVILTQICAATSPAIAVPTLAIFAAMTLTALAKLLIGLHALIDRRS